MNKHLCLVTIALIFLLTIKLNATSTDSLAYYRVQYAQTLSKYHELTLSYSQLEKDIAALDAQILRLGSAENANWNTNRKISRLTARKAEVSSKMTDIRTKLVTQKTSVDLIFNKYYTLISTRIESILQRYDHTADPRQRQNLTRELIELIEQRGQIIASRPPTPNEPVLSNKYENVIALLTKYKHSAAIRTDVIRILDDKIRQIDMIITAAIAERDLRQRLNQLNLEMTGFSGEAVNREIALQNNDRDQTDGTTWTEPTYNNGGKDALSQTDNAALPITTQISTTADYLSLFQKIPTNNLPSYIAQMDSLRNYYQKQLQEINGIK